MFDSPVLDILNGDEEPTLASEKSSLAFEFFKFSSAMESLHQFETDVLLDVEE
jgi:hypothetical protein